MADLPPELLQHVAEDVGDDLSLFHLRLVSKTLNCVVTPLAFRLVVVRDSVKSAQAVSFLQGCDESVTSVVHEVVFRGDMESSEDNQWIAESKTSGEAGREALAGVFSSLTKFSNLQKLRFDFHSWYQEPTTFEVPTPSIATHFLLLQNRIFDALASNPPPPLVALTLNNIIAIPDAIYTQEDFQRIFSPLQELEISMLSEEDGEIALYSEEPLAQFWWESVAHMVRSAKAVTTLTMRRDQRVGVQSFPGTFLPHLTLVVLQKFELGPDSDVVEFILSHKATITHLELYDCYIDGGENSVFPRPWHAVLALLETELSALRHFVCKNSDLDYKYTYLDPGWGYLPYGGDVFKDDGVPKSIKAQDLLAFESLMATIKSRRGEDDQRDL